MGNNIINSYSVGDPYVSAFENAVIGYNPTALYRFRDADFSTQITDSGPNGYHLTKQIATASRGAQLRSTHPGGLNVPVINNANWLTQGITYLRAATTGLDVPLGGAASASYLVGIKLISAPSAANDARIFSVGNIDSDLSGSNSIAAMFWYMSGSTNIAFQNRAAGGNMLMTDTAPFLGESQIYSSHIDWLASPEGTLDASRASEDVQKYSGTLGVSAYDNLDRATFVGGRINTDLTPYNRAAFVIDHVSYFIPALSIANLDSLRALYRTEII